MNPEVYVYIRIYYVVWGFWGLKVWGPGLILGVAFKAFERY